MDKAKNENEIIPQLFRQEYSKMTAVLCRHFGLQYIQIAQDIVSDTFLKATEHWAVAGVPDNPVAWLYTVAKNKIKDYFRRNALFAKKVMANIGQENLEPEIQFEYSEAGIADSQLLMIFAVCNPGIAAEAQICLALQVLCGFGITEIANAFLTSKETIKKRLYRAKAKLRKDKFRIAGLHAPQIASRLNTVLKTLYLLFNEGYYSKSNDRQIRKELCREAIKLTLILVDNKLTDLPEVNALLSLMCFQSARLEARQSTTGAIILFEDQDRALWDQLLINRGNYYLVKATEDNVSSRYHLEAGIAYWHTTEHPQKWKHILALYDQLMLIESTPVTALNRTFVLAKVYGNEKAIIEMEKQELVRNEYDHMLLGYLYTTSDLSLAIQHYQHALALTQSGTEKQVIEKRIDNLYKRQKSRLDPC